MEERAADALLQAGLRKYNNLNPSAAQRKFKQVVKRYPTSRAAGEAQYMRGRSMMAKNRWIKAFELLQECVQDYPNYENFDLVIGAQFECATALMEGARGKIFGVIPGFKQYAESILQFERLVANAPYSDYAPLALMNIAFVAERQDDAQLAIDALDRLINFYPQNMLAPDAYYNLAQTYSGLVQNEEYDQGSTRQAISYYEDFLYYFPKAVRWAKSANPWKTCWPAVVSRRVITTTFTVQTMPHWFFTMRRSPRSIRRCGRGPYTH